MTLVVTHLDELGAVGVADPAASGVDNRARPDLRGYAAAVVIDVVRAFTVAPWCLARGAERVLLARDADAALAARVERFPQALLLRDGRPDPRFDLPNAPGRIAGEDLTGRTIVQATGNGTRGAHAVAGVPIILCASFVTARATAAVLAGTAGSVLCVPTEGDEDVALADYLAALLDGGGTADAEPYLRRVRDSPAGQECRERGTDPAYPGVHPDDLDRCLQVDAFDHALQAIPDGQLLALVPVGPSASLSSRDPRRGTTRADGT